MVLYKFLFPTAKLYPKLWDICPKPWDIYPKAWDIRPKAWDIEIWWDIKTLSVGFLNFYCRLGRVLLWGVCGIMLLPSYIRLWIWGKNKRAEAQLVVLPPCVRLCNMVFYAFTSAPVVFIFSDINSITNISAKPVIINAMAMQN